MVWSLRSRHRGLLSTLLFRPSEPLSCRWRNGFATGEAELRDGDYFGTVLTARHG